MVADERKWLLEHGFASDASFPIAATNDGRYVEILLQSGARVLFCGGSFVGRDLGKFGYDLVPENLG